MKDVADDLALIVRNAIAYIKELERQVNELKQAAEPVQEPVAWLFTNLQSGDYDFCYQEDEHDHDREMWHKQPLYAAPPQPEERNFCSRCGKRTNDIRS